MDDVRGLIRWATERSVPAIVAASALAVSVLIVGPLLLQQRPTHRFLLWNLALAWVPFVAALWVEALAKDNKMRAALVCGAVWLLFLPNAPYLISDLTHLDNASPTPWLDLGRLVAFGWAGLLLGLVSLRIVHRVVRAHVGALAGWAVAVAAAGASGIGIALGRFSRVNSWEVVTQPTVVVAEIARLLADYRIMAVAGFFGLFLLVMYTAIGPAREPVTGASG